MDVPRNAVGTLQEVEAAGLDPNVFRTCHKKAEGVKGCQFTAIDKETGQPMCQLNAMGKHGPHNYAVEIMDGDTKKSFVRLVDCFWLANEAEDIKRNKGLIRIVAAEGQEYTMVTGMPDPTVPSKRSDKTIKAVVPAFPRPTENPALADFLSHGKAMLEARGTVEAQREARFFGQRGAGLDAGFEGDAGSGGGGGEEGRGRSKKG